MKQFYVAFLILLSSCMAVQRKGEKIDMWTDVTIDEVHVAKHSKVTGHIIYKDILVPVTNSKSGYYYRKYKFKEGDKLLMNVTITTEISDVTVLSAETDFNTYSNN